MNTPKIADRLGAACGAAYVLLILVGNQLASGSGGAAHPTGAQDIADFSRTPGLAENIGFTMEILGFLARAYELSGGTLRLELIDVLGSDWGAVQVQHVRARLDGRTLDCVEVLAHEIVDGRIVRTYHRPDQYAIDAFFS